MHVFLTGERGIGKSQAIRTAVSLIGRVPYGFLTRFGTEGDPTAALYMVSPSRQEPMGEAERIAVRRDGRITLLPDRFDSLAADLLREASCHPEGIILMDECGHLEAGLTHFHAEILRCLDGDIPVLGALRLDQPWHALIRNHPGVKVFRVTAENRDSLPALIAETILNKEAL